ncbi:MAG: hypothetical protein D6681_21160, partial [Calditrichaeota bacterium]
SGNWPQYAAAPIAFRLLDPDGNPLAPRIDPAWHLEAEAVWEMAGRRTPLSLNSDEPGHWQGEFTPREAGPFTLRASVTARRGGEEVRLVQDALLTSANIQPMTLVQGVVQNPAPETEFAWRDIFWRYRPLEIEVAVVDGAGQLLAPAQILEQPNGFPLQVEIISPAGDSSGPLPLKAGDAPGQYELSMQYDPTIPWYAHRDLGRYEIRLSPGAALKNTYIYKQPSFGKSTFIHLTRHPQWWLLPTLVGALLLGLCIWGVRQVYLHLWSIEGTLSIEKDKMNIWSRRLRDYGKHTLVFSSREVPQGIRRIKVYQNRGATEVNVEVILQGGGRLSNSMHNGNQFPLMSASGKVGTLKYERGVGANATPGISISGGVIGYGLLALLFLAGLGGVLFAVVQSLA